MVQQHFVIIGRFLCLKGLALAATGRAKPNSASPNIIHHLQPFLLGIPKDRHATIVAVPCKCQTNLCTTDHVQYTLWVQLHHSATPEEEAYFRNPSRRITAKIIARVQYRHRRRRWISGHLLPERRSQGAVRRSRQTRYDGSGIDNCAGGCENRRRDREFSSGNTDSDQIEGVKRIAERNRGQRCVF